MRFLLRIAHNHFFWQDLYTGFKIFVVWYWLLSGAFMFQFGGFFHIKLFMFWYEFWLKISTEEETTEFKYPSTTDYRRADTSTVTATAKKIQKFQTSTISSPLTTATYGTENTINEPSTTVDRTTWKIDTTTNDQEFQTQTTSPTTGIHKTQGFWLSNFLHKQTQLDSNSRLQKNQV